MILDKRSHILNRILHKISQGIRFIFTLPIHLYRHLISPLLPGACIYTPTCSAYSTRAIMHHGVVKGLILGITRIFRCAGGLFTGGDDPVPQEFSFRDIGSKYKKFYARRRSHRQNN